MIGDGSDATDLVLDESDPQLLVNMSLWRDVDALAAFVYCQSDHLSFMGRRKERFERIALLKVRGLSAEAFTFRQPFAAPDRMPAHPVRDECG